MCNHFQDAEEEELDRLLEILPSLALPAALPKLPVQIYPKYQARIVMQERGSRTLVAMRWGIERFIGQGKTKPVTNARSDKFSSRTWKTCVETRRCLIPATGYYEPGLGPVGAKGEILFTVKDRPRFFLAGLWDENADGRAFSMVTTEPNDYVRPYHDRMPVVIADTDAQAWLGDAPLPPDELVRLCRGLPSEALHHESLAPKLKIIRPDRSPPADDQPSLF